ncbi:MAG: Lrp/AsnC family transcriptional regulator [Myxococcota bacterium]
MADERMVLDELDRRIVDHLKRDGRATVAAIAERVSLSRSATSERIRRLEDQGAVLGYQARLSPRVSGRLLEAVVGVRARPGVERQALEAWLCGRPAITEALHLTGQHDYLLRVRCRDVAELDALVMAMKADADIVETETRVVLRALPVEPDEVGRG